MNYRSLPPIVGVANKIIDGPDSAARDNPSARTAAYYLPYKPAAREDTIASFRSLLTAAGLDPTKGVVLCRSTDLTAEWRSEMDGQGVGVVRCLAKAAISRDRGDIRRAFEKTCVALTRLLANKHGSLFSRLSRPADERMRGLRRLIWSFVRDSKAGLPPADLVADTGWHPVLVARMRALIGTIVAEFEFEAAGNLGQRLAKTKLGSKPLMAAPTIATDGQPAFRTSTVHQVKGESLEAVLYVAKKPQVRALLGGTGSEEGRIGYVALTRARDIFVLAVPDTCLKEFEPELQAAVLTRA